MTTTAPPHGQLQSVGALTADMFLVHGIEHLFLVPSQENSFLLRLRELGVDPVLAQSERASAFMADAYSRLTARPTFVYAAFGAGVTAALSGVLEALYGRSPLVVIGSETAQGSRHLNTYEIDQVALFRSVVKWGARVERGDRLPDLFRSAVREAVTGVPGPTYLGVPNDLFREQTDIPEFLWAEQSCFTAPGYRMRPDSASVDRIAQRLVRAERPLILAGSGVISSRAWDELTALAERYSLPVVTSAGGKGAIAETHPLAQGVTGKYSRTSANDLVRHADFLLAVGTRLTDRTTAAGRTISPKAFLAHVDIDARTLGRTMSEELSMVGDARLTLEELAEALDGAAGWASWAAAAGEQTANWKKQRAIGEQRGFARGELSPVTVVAALRGALAAGDFVVSDAGRGAAWTTSLYDVQKAGTQHLRATGSVGWALPAALGAQVARPEDHVVALVDKRAFVVHASELETAVQRGLPVIVLLLDDGRGRVVPFGRGADAGNGTHGTLTDYAAVAEAFGASVTRVAEPIALRSALHAALESSTPVVLDVCVNHTVGAPIVGFEELEDEEP